MKSKAALKAMTPARSALLRQKSLVGKDAKVGDRGPEEGQGGGQGGGGEGAGPGQEGQEGRRSGKKLAAKDAGRAEEGRRIEEEVRP